MRPALQPLHRELEEISLLVSRLARDVVRGIKVRQYKLEAQWLSARMARAARMGRDE